MLMVRCRAIPVVCHEHLAHKQNDKHYYRAHGLAYTRGLTLKNVSIFTGLMHQTQKSF
jgi:hypothetical protein